MIITSDSTTERRGTWTECATSASWNYASSTSCDFLISAASLLLTAQGNLAHGLVKFDANSASTDLINVTVKVFYNKEELIDEMSVAFTDGRVRIVTPERYGLRTHFEVTVHFPSPPPGGEPFLVNDIQTEFGNFTHEIYDLSSAVFIRSMSIRTSNGSISAQSLTAHRVKLATSNGLISGTYHVSRRLEMSTCNSSLTGQLHLYNKGGDRTELVMMTSNAAVNPIISLHSSSTQDDQHLAKFSVRGSTSNSSMTIAFAEAPVRHSLDLSATTSNSSITTQLHPTFQGTFKTTPSARLVINRNVQDPENKGRTRTIPNPNSRWSVRQGEVYWDSANRNRSTVDLVTSNSDVIIEL